jgi:lysozyme
MSYKAIDVSKHQGTINWNKVKAAGIQAAFIRAGYGRYDTQQDSKFSENIKGAAAAGLLIGVYWYSYAATEAEAKQEAETCLKVIKPYKNKITLPVFFDQEYESNIKAASKLVRTACCTAFMDVIKAAGFDTGLYCSYDWITNWISNVDGKKWVAQYASKCSYKKDDLYMWQYSSKGSVDGISGNVDMDILYGEITSSTAATTKWVKTASGWKYGSYKASWAKVGGRWYYFDAAGVAVTGWRTIKGKDYYFATAAFAADSGGKVKECQCMEATD